MTETNVVFIFHNRFCNWQLALNTIVHYPVGSEWFCWTDPSFCLYAHRIWSNLELSHATAVVRVLRLKVYYWLFCFCLCRSGKFRVTDDGFYWEYLHWIWSNLCGEPGQNAWNHTYRSIRAWQKHNHQPN